MIHVIAGAESNSTPSGESAKLSRVVMFDAVTASTWRERLNLIHLNQIGEHQVRQLNHHNALNDSCHK